MDFAGRMDCVASSSTTFLGVASPSRFGLSDFFIFRGAAICRGVKMGFFSGALTGEGGLGGGGGGGTCSLLILGGLLERSPMGVFRSGMLNSLTPSGGVFLNSLTLSRPSPVAVGVGANSSMASPVGFAAGLFAVPVGASKGCGGSSIGGSFGRLDGGFGTFGFGGEGTMVLSDEGGFCGDDLRVEEV